MLYEDGRGDDVFGQELILNLYECDPKKISDGEHIRQFVIELCDEVIEMKRYGEALIPHFGHDNPITSGYSLFRIMSVSFSSIFCFTSSRDGNTAFCDRFRGVQPHSQ